MEHTAIGLEWMHFGNSPLDWRQLRTIFSIDATLQLIEIESNQSVQNLIAF